MKAKSEQIYTEQWLKMQPTDRLYCVPTNQLSYCPSANQAAMESLLFDEIFPFCHKNAIESYIMIKLFGFANKDGKLMGRRDLLASFELSEYDNADFYKVICVERCFFNAIRLVAEHSTELSKIYKVDMSQAPETVKKASDSGNSVMNQLISFTKFGQRIPVDPAKVQNCSRNPNLPK